MTDWKAEYERLAEAAREAHKLLRVYWKGVPCVTNRWTDVDQACSALERALNEVSK